jgi:hypothetical protein
MNDTFDPSESVSHGEIGVRAARHSGFRGRVVQNHTEGPTPSDRQLRASSQLRFDELQGEEARTALTHILEEDTAGMYRQQVPLLDKMTQVGTRNSAANISWGSSPAGATQGLYGLAAAAWEGDTPEHREQARVPLGNMSRAFQLEPGKLLDSDPAVHAPERQKLQQSLADFSHDLMENSPVVGQARERYEQAVSDFESGHNSVVVSAGNDGLALERLAARNHGLTIEPPKDFFKSILDTQEVTSVGATRFFTNGSKLEERKAGYSNPHAQVDIYASGSVGLQNPNKVDNYGTSFSAPRVGATMAELHAQNPHLSSSQVETLMKNSLTHELDANAGPVQVLSYDKNYELLKTGTF